MRLFGLILVVCALLCSVAARAQACDTSPEANRRLVLEFYTLGLVDREPRAAFDRYMAPDFIEHKPDIPGGTRQATADFLSQLMGDIPEAQWEILRSAAQDDLVFVHARMTPALGAEAYALADIFRVSDCRIVEHWDVVGGPSTLTVNPHPRF
jgi:predicted SnoaL-like aldol condensation-catalyzing enzyme